MKMLAMLKRQQFKDIKSDKMELKGSKRQGLYVCDNEKGKRLGQVCR